MCKGEGASSSCVNTLPARIYRMPMYSPVHHLLSLLCPRWCCCTITRCADTVMLLVLSCHKGMRAIIRERCHGMRGELAGRRQHIWYLCGSHASVRQQTLDSGAYLPKALVWECQCGGLTLSDKRVVLVRICHV